jgi:hypothetical protein
MVIPARPGSCSKSGDGAQQSWSSRRDQPEPVDAGNRRGLPIGILLLKIPAEAAGHGFGCPESARLDCIIKGIGGFLTVWS